MDREEYDLDETPIVLLKEEGVMGVVRQVGAHYSTVTYSLGGEEFTEIRENDEFVVIDNIIFKHVTIVDGD